MIKAKIDALKLFVKGLCMGISDIIPGVSGGTMALILGIYQPFIEAIRSVNARPVLGLFTWVASGFKAEALEQLKTEWKAIHWNFLLPLLAGIVLAMAIGSMIIPTLMDEYPEAMRALFFGLILASLSAPYKMLGRDSGTRTKALISAIIFAVFGFVVTSPSLKWQAERQSVEIEARGDEAPRFLDLIRSGPSAQGAEDVYWAEGNESLRLAITKSQPQVARELEEKRQALAGQVAQSKRAIKARNEPYRDLAIPLGTTIVVERPGYLFVFICGFIAISAMVLPGISGSFMLLILGAYFFVLNAAKGFIGSLLQLNPNGASFAYLACFVTGLIAGLMIFTRILAWLLKHKPAATMGALIGLMVGCMRGIWPFRAVSSSGDLENVLPEAWGSIEVSALGMMVLGFSLVFFLNRLQRQTAT